MSYTPKYSMDLVSAHHANWTQWLGHLKGKPVNALEIGSFEGRSAVWMMQNILTHMCSTLTCVDTFHAGFDMPEIKDNSLLYRFMDNTSPWGSRIFTHQGKSSQILRNLPLLCYDCAYIDGSHFASDVLTDCILTWQLMKPGGTIIFDDYFWNVRLSPVECPKIAIDAFLNCFHGQYETIYRGYQICIRKSPEV